MSSPIVVRAVVAGMEVRSAVRAGGPKRDNRSPTYEFDW